LRTIDGRRRKKLFVRLHFYDSKTERNEDDAPHPVVIVFDSQKLLRSPLSEQDFLFDGNNDVT
jgi:hypothetical protein